jgi:hypothetical protein
MEHWTTGRDCAAPPRWIFVHSSPSPRPCVSAREFSRSRLSTGVHPNPRSPAISRHRDEVGRRRGCPLASSPTGEGQPAGVSSAPCRCLRTGVHPKPTISHDLPPSPATGTRVGGGVAAPSRHRQPEKTSPRGSHLRPVAVSAPGCTSSHDLPPFPASSRLRHEGGGLQLLDYPITQSGVPSKPAFGLLGWNYPIMGPVDPPPPPTTARHCPRLQRQKIRPGRLPASSAGAGCPPTAQSQATTEGQMMSESQSTRTPKATNPRSPASPASARKTPGCRGASLRLPNYSITQLLNYPMGDLPPPPASGTRAGSRTGRTSWSSVRSGNFFSRSEDRRHAFRGGPRNVYIMVKCPRQLAVVVPEWLASSDWLQLAVKMASGPARLGFSVVPRACPEGGHVAPIPWEIRGGGPGGGRQPGGLFQGPGCAQTCWVQEVGSWPAAPEVV